MRVGDAEEPQRTRASAVARNENAIDGGNARRAERGEVGGSTSTNPGQRGRLKACAQGGIDGAFSP